jgi:hypothetical protein
MLTDLSQTNKAFPAELSLTVAELGLASADAEGHRR